MERYAERNGVYLTAVRNPAFSLSLADDVSILAERQRPFRYRTRKKGGRSDPRSPDASKVNLDWYFSARLSQFEELPFFSMSFHS